MAVIDFSKSKRGARVLRIAGCRMRARQRAAQAEREPQFEAFHLEAAKKWLLLASELEEDRCEIISFENDAADRG